MSFNYVGTPVGAAVAGAMASWSIDSAIVFGAVASFVSAVFALTMIPAAE
jgi:hypothetical protein